mmetsp:Transcript_25951/g.52568  ORF Transcript_25951/g.52568 Transcript_25951/m.52568 type:complete len:675 (+) Transcript_25951:348-2372(+)
MHSEKPPLPKLQPVLLRRTSSINPPNGFSGITGASTPLSGSSHGAPLSGGSSHGPPPGIVDPDASNPVVADEEPGNSATVMNMSTHKRKQSGPVDNDIILAMERMEKQEEMEQMEERYNMGDVEPAFDFNNSRRVSSSFPGAYANSSFLNPRTMSLVAAALVLLALAAFHSSSETIDHSAPIAAGSNTANLGASNSESSSKSITYGEEHMEIVGSPKEAHVHEYNKVRYFDKPDKMTPMISKGPILFNQDMGGLHLFEEVCVTNNMDALRWTPMETSLRGLVYFTGDQDILDNEKRCVPCKDTKGLEGWDSASPEEAVLGHKCGMNGLHAMFASSVGDWSECISREENMKLMEEYGQTQSPLDVDTVHLFTQPTFLLQFNVLDTEVSMFDMLMTYLPHWQYFRDNNEFPFDSVISHSLEGCLSHNHHWFCEILHQINAFGPAKEIPWESDEKTLYCFKQLFYNEVGYQRNLDKDDLVTKDLLGEFREILFRKFALSRRRNHHASQKAAAEQGESEGSNDEYTKIIFYDNKLSEKTVWNEMDTLIAKARSLEKYQNVKFVTVDDFSDLTVAEQAKSFNEADAVIMVHGEQMTNAIFAVDGTTFVEVGCKVSSLIGNPKFMELMDSTYQAVERCTEGADGNSVCVVCDSDEDDSNFTMTAVAFENLIDGVVRSLQK